MISDDSALRARAETLARQTAGCGSGCTLAGYEGKRGVLGETITFTFRDAGTYVVSCKRPYIAFGEHACTATKQ